MTVMSATKKKNPCTTVFDSDKTFYNPKNGTNSKNLLAATVEENERDPKRPAAELIYQKIKFPPTTATSTEVAGWESCKVIGEVLTKSVQRCELIATMFGNDMMIGLAKQGKQEKIPEGPASVYGVETEHQVPSGSKPGLSLAVPSNTTLSKLAEPEWPSCSLPGV
eukprot:g17943.t1